MIIDFSIAVYDNAQCSLLDPNMHCIYSNITILFDSVVRVSSTHAS